VTDLVFVAWLWPAILVGFAQRVGCAALALDAVCDWLGW
jgi:hypothetical protein